MISRKRGDDIYIGVRPQKEIRKKQDADGNENLVEPDISVICDPEKIDEKGCHGAPDWVIEIVSPSKRPSFLPDGVCSVYAPVIE